jgi:hypothetical protein
MPILLSRPRDLPLRSRWLWEDQTLEQCHRKGALGEAYDSKLDDDQYLV